MRVGFIVVGLVAAWEGIVHGRAWTSSLVVALAVSSCTWGEPAPEELDPEPPGQEEHDEAVARLSRRVDSEDGWLVYTLPIDNEGGGDITWWLHPCDPATDDQRHITGTVHRGSDVDFDPGSYRVGEFEVECVAPSREIQVPPRVVITSVDVVPVWTSLGSVGNARSRVWAHEPGPVRVTITDPVTDRVHVLTGDGDHAAGACDGATRWGATWIRERYLSVGVGSCVHTLEALPETVLGLLEPLVEPVDGDEVPFTFPDPDDIEHQRATPAWVDGDTFTFPDPEILVDIQDDIEHELATSGWVGSESDIGTEWLGPCHDVGDGEYQRTHATIGVPGGSNRAEITMAADPCDG